jgi:hypothetical protein
MRSFRAPCSRLDPNSHARSSSIPSNQIRSRPLSIVRALPRMETAGSAAITAATCVDAPTASNPASAAAARGAPPAPPATADSDQQKKLLEETYRRRPLSQAAARAGAASPTTTTSSSSLNTATNGGRGPRDSPQLLVDVERKLDADLPTLGVTVLFVVSLIAYERGVQVREFGGIEMSNACGVVSAAARQSPARGPPPPIVIPHPRSY